MLRCGSETRGLYRLASCWPVLRSLRLGMVLSPAVAPQLPPLGTRPPLRRLTITPCLAFR
jgi:hypothetical protein